MIQRQRSQKGTRSSRGRKHRRGDRTPTEGRQNESYAETHQTFRNTEYVSNMETTVKAFFLSTMTPVWIRVGGLLGWATSKLHAGGRATKGRQEPPWYIPYHAMVYTQLTMVLFTAFWLMHSKKQYERPFPRQFPYLPGVRTCVCMYLCTYVCM